MRARLLGVCVAALVSSAAGCGARAVQQPPAQIGRLKRQVVSLRTERDEQARTIAELRNRIFILEDRVDTQRVAISRQLPVVRLEPVGSAPQRDDGAGDDADDGGDGGEDDQQEQQDAAPRPVLKLYERSSGGGGGYARAPVRSMPAAALGPQDALPVVAMEGMPQPRASGISSGTAARAPAPGAAESSSADDASSAAIAAYEAAFALFRARRFDEALAAFGNFVQRYARHSYADNALYWRGECYYARRDFRSALAEFEAVLARYPDGNKAPDAMLKAALSRAELGDVARARAMLYRLAEQFPRSDAARIAQERVARLGPRSGEVQR